MTLSKTRIGIAGLGQIGGSIAARLHADNATPSLLGFDIRTDLCQAAIKGGIVARIAESEAELVNCSDIVVMALPISEILSFMTRHRDALISKLAVTDTGSIKAEVMAHATRLGFRNFVGGHPMAGTEKRGAASWNPDLFQGAVFFVTPGKVTSQQAIAAVAALLSQLGAHPVPAEPEKHDRIVATTGNLTHLLAYRLLEQYAAIDHNGVDTSQFQGPSFLSATRVAHSDQETAFQMLWHNRENLAASLRSFIDGLDEAAQALESGDADRFRHALYGSREGVNL
ncbi:MAG TPA: prephenate dehydrogenase [Candidatus Acidoferrum sp.]|nr:prephenate dehydrogenase [Candidatus Acidoferrum sp.]